MFGNGSQVDEATSASLALALVALGRTTETLAKRVEELGEERQRDILTPREAAAFLGFSSVDAFEAIVKKEEIPKHYISERHPRYFVDELRKFVRDR